MNIANFGSIQNCTQVPQRAAPGWKTIPLNPTRDGADEGPEAETSLRDSLCGFVGESDRAREGESDAEELKMRCVSQEGRPRFRP